MAQSLKFSKARLSGLKLKFGQTTDVSLEVTAESLPRAFVDMLNVSYLKENGGRENVIRYDLTLRKVRFQLTPAEGMESKRLTVDCEAVEHFEAVRRKDKNRGRITEIRFRAACLTSPVSLVEYAFNIGGVQGVCTLEPLQGDLFDVAPATIPAKSETRGTVKEVKLSETTSSKPN